MRNSWRDQSSMAPQEAHLFSLMAHLAQRLKEPLSASHSVQELFPGDGSLAWLEQSKLGSPL